MAEFRGPNDFLGQYEGHWDGRRARLEIEDQQIGHSGTWLCNIWLYEGKATFAAFRVPHAESKHTIRDVDLRGFGRTVGARRIGLMLLHTWNTDYLSGNEIRNGKEYGFSFERSR